MTNQDAPDSQKPIYLKTPLTDEAVAELKVGNKVLVSGPVYTMRDASSRRFSVDVTAGKPPVNLQNQLIFYMGPTPARPGRPIGAAGPTTSARMDAYVAELTGQGVKGLMGKGRRSPEARTAMQAGPAVYLVATGGAGAFLSRHVGEAQVAAYPELGPEAIYKLTLEDFPAIVAYDIYGGDLFQEEWSKWKLPNEASS